MKITIQELLELVTQKEIRSFTYIENYMEFNKFFSITFRSSRKDRKETGVIGYYELIAKLKEHLYKEGYQVITYKSRVGEYVAILFRKEDFYYNMGVMNQKALYNTKGENELEVFQNIYTKIKKR